MRCCPEGSRAPRRTAAAPPTCAPSLRSQNLPAWGRSGSGRSRRRGILPQLLLPLRRPRQRRRTLPAAATTTMSTRVLPRRRRSTPRSTSCATSPGGRSSSSSAYLRGCVLRSTRWSSCSGSATTPSTMRRAPLLRCGQASGTTPTRAAGTDEHPVPPSPRSHPNLALTPTLTHCRQVVRRAAGAGGPARLWRRRGEAGHAAALGARLCGGDAPMLPSYHPVWRCVRDCAAVTREPPQHVGLLQPWAHRMGCSPGCMAGSCNRSWRVTATVAGD
jgi:hypothetical protein